MAGVAVPFNGKVNPQYPYLMHVIDAQGYLIGYQYLNGALTVLAASAWDNGLTAFAGGGQANATPMNYRNSRFTTVATGADSSVLPQSVAGMYMTVVNAGAASMNVFPATGEAINALAANAAFAVAAGKSADFFCSAVGQWNTGLSA